MILKDRWKLIIPYSANSKVLNAMYNLNNDPYEINNLIGKNPEREKFADKAEELHKCLFQWLLEKKSKHFDGVAKRKLN